MFSLRDLSLTLETEPLFFKEKLQPTGFSIDSRQIQEGDVFVALKTASNDGHHYLKNAFQAGAVGAIVSEVYAESMHVNPTDLFKNLWVVPDPYGALKQLAMAKRNKSQAVFIGITGSVGKTTTKEFLSYLLGKLIGKEKVLTSRGNFNNHLGLPLTLLELEDKHDICICELGANHAGEIKTLCEILKPNHGVLTSVSECHLEGFGSLQTIYETKFDLVRSLPTEGIGVLPAADEKLKAMADDVSASVYYSGLHSSLKPSLSEVRQQKGCVEFCFQEKYRFSFPSEAEFYALNAGMALTLIQAMGYDLNKIDSVWHDFKLPEGRFSRMTYVNDVEIIFDGYNASPLSFKKGIQAINDLSVRGKKILVFSDMLELGEQTKDLHRELGQQIVQSDFSLVIAYGKYSKFALESVTTGGKALFFAGNADEAANILNSHLKHGDLIYFKASRGMQIEKVRDALLLKEAKQTRL